MTENQIVRLTDLLRLIFYVLCAILGVLFVIAVRMPHQ
jgi:hypothetical protein